MISGPIHRLSHRLIVRAGVAVTVATAKTGVPVASRADVPAILDLFAGIDCFQIEFQVHIVYNMVSSTIV